MTGSVFIMAAGIMRAGRRVLQAAVLVLATFLFLIPLVPSPARAASMSPMQREQSAYSWALTQAGKPYAWGGTGPYGYDCSGIVFAAYLRAGVTLPRSTYDMINSGRLVRTWQPAAGDLAFFGSGHVEFVTRGHNRTYGALHAGTVLGVHPWSGWWHPTAFFRLRY